MHIAILCPLASQVQAPAVDALIETVLETERFIATEHPGGRLTRLIAFRGQTAMARTALGIEAYDSGADWFFWIDDDMILPKNVVKRLLAHGKNFISGAYFSRTASDPLGRGQYPLCAFNFVNDQNKPFQPPALEPRGLREVQVVGFGCLLMHRSVWADVWKLSNGSPFRTEYNLTEDVYFEMFARKAGHSIWLDTDLIAGHLKLVLITDKNRTQIGGEVQDVCKSPTPIAEAAIA